MEVEGLALQNPDASAVNNFMHNDQSDMTKDVEGSSNVPASTSESLNSDNNNASNSNFSCMEDGNGEDDLLGDDDELCDDEYIDEEDDYMFDYNDEVDDDSDYLSMQAQFDNVDLPAGVEASVPWLKEPTPSLPVTSSVSALQVCSSSSQPASEGTSKNLISQPVGIIIESSTSSSSAAQSSSGKCDDKQGDGYEVIRKYQLFKHFDIVDDFSDHHYNNMGFQGQLPPKAWLKKIQDEWKILENDLPDTIYVRVYETRMDLLRAVIVGPQGTPYHDGLFVFDAFFPSTYPDTPPVCICSSVLIIVMCILLNRFIF